MNTYSSDLLSNIINLFKNVKGRVWSFSIRIGLPVLVVLFEFIKSLLDELGIVFTHGNSSNLYFKKLVRKVIMKKLTSNAATVIQ